MGWEGVGGGGAPAGLSRRPAPAVLAPPKPAQTDTLASAKSGEPSRKEQRAPCPRLFMTGCGAGGKILELLYFISQL